MKMDKRGSRKERNPNRCALCTYSTNHLSNYNSHVKTAHSDNKPFKCPECPFRSKWKRHVKIHVKNVHLLKSPSSSRPFPCSHPGCNFAAKENGNLKKHAKIHNHPEETPKFSCFHPNCNYSTNKKEHFTHHTRTHTGEKPFLCPFESCSYSAAQKSQLVSHSRIHTKEKPYKCPEANCEYAAAHRYTFTQHQLFNHPKSNPNPNPTEGEGEGEGRPCPLFACPLCEYSSKTKRNLSRHTNRHTLEKFFKCDESNSNCSFEARTKSALKIHKLVHLDEKPLACPFESCEFRCKRKGTLSTHLKTHSEERQYKCELCPYRGKTRIVVSSHLKAVHSDIKPFKCVEPKCGYAAKTNRDLNRHVLIHKGEKKYSCSFPLCEYKAIAEHRVKMHEKAFHVTEKKFKCDLCEFATKTNRNLVVHVKTHTKKKSL